MSELGKLVDLIENKTKRLINRKRELEEENSKLKNQLTEMKAENENQHKVINELKDKYQVLRIAKTIESKGDNKEAIKELYWIVNKSEIYPFEQFDLKFNRPDIVLSRIGKVDTTLINAYHNAYLKRIKKMNFTKYWIKLKK